MREMIPVFHADPMLRRIGFASADHARKVASKFGRVKSQIELDIDENIEKARKEREHGQESI
jgi:hypothetical protein